MIESTISHLIFTESYETFENMEEWCDMSGFNYEEACICVWKNKDYLDISRMQKFMDDFEMIMTLDEACELG